MYFFIGIKDLFSYKTVFQTMRSIGRVISNGFKDTSTKC